MPRFQNEAVQNILSRRSVRRFDPAMEVPKDITELLLECACAAPSAHNFRPWHFIVISGRERLDALSEIHPYGKMLKTATLAIAVCGQKTHHEVDYVYWEEDCAAAMQNILLAANASGLGSVWLGVMQGADGLEEKIKAIYEVPDNFGMLGIAAIGYPLETKDPHEGIDPCVVHVNRW